MCLILQRIRIQVQVLNPCKYVKKLSEEMLFIKSRWIARQMFLSRFNIWSSIDSSIDVSIENYKIQIFRSVFHAYPSYVFRFSFLTILDIYKDYFKGRHKGLHLLLHAYCDRRQFVHVHLSLEEVVAFVCRRVL